MKYITAILAIALTACNSGKKDNISLTLNVDKPTDVERKIGKPDSIIRKNIEGQMREKWYFKRDSVVAIFLNDILTGTYTPHSEPHEPVSEAERERMRTESTKKANNRRMDSIATLEMEAALKAEKEKNK